MKRKRKTAAELTAELERDPEHLALRRARYSSALRLFAIEVTVPQGIADNISDTDRASALRPAE